MGFPPVVAALALSLAAMITPAALPAQGCIGLFCPPNDPPAVGLTPWGGSFSGSASSYALTLTVTWCDDFNLTAGSQLIELDGLDVTAQFDFQWGSSPGCGAYATSTGTVTLAQGSHMIAASIRDQNFNLGSASTSYSYTQILPVYGVAVTPDGQRVTVAPSQATSRSFTVQNTGNQNVTYNLSLTTCSGAALPSGCNLSTSSVALSGGTSTSVGVSFTASATVGHAGEIRVTATQSGDPAITDAGSYFLYVSVPGAPTVNVAGVNPDSAVERDLCLTVAAGASASYECGDLRITHELPSVRTLNKLRTPTLLYNSRAAMPYGLVMADVGLPLGTAIPDQVQATLSFMGRQYSGQWTGSDWEATSASRITLWFDAGTDATGIYDYSLEVATVYGATRYPVTKTGKMILVNRATSAFGAGWWLAGLERLQAAGTNDFLWIGGDGSARYYKKIAGVNIWRAPSLDRPDSLTYDGTHYIRHLPHGVRVKFDAQLRHVQTVNRLGHVTVFSYDATTGVLSTIAVPPNAAHTYTFAYSGGYLTTVTAPPVDNRPRVTTLAHAHGGARVTGITGPDNGPENRTTLFMIHPGSNLVGERTDRRNSVTSYTYDGTYRLISASLAMGSGQSPITTDFAPAERKGLSGNSAIDTSRVYTRVDGPRTDVGDTTIFWLDRFGSPRRIRNAVGHEAVVTRANTQFPGLVTRYKEFGGRILGAAYDGRGNVLWMADSNGTSAGVATTTFEWHATWDFPTKVISPVGESVLMDYDQTAGHRLWQQAGPNSARRVNFSYNSKGLLSAIKDPLSSVADSILYDSVGGFWNLRRTRTPLGFYTEYLQDGIGRDTLVSSPIESVPSSTVRLMQRTFYDLLGRDTLALTRGPKVPYSKQPQAAISYTPAETLVVKQRFDAEGNLLSVWRRSYPDTNAIDSITTVWEYDRAHRRTKEIVQDSAGTGTRAEQTVYDPAGNVVELITRRGHTLTMEYDALNRLKKRTVPPVTYPQWALPGGTVVGWTYPLYPNSGTGLLIEQDIATFAYDSAGNLVEADNNYARVRRGYALNGTLLADTLRVRTYDGADFAQHVYGLRYTYDLNGRRTRLFHPEPIAPRIGSTIKDEVIYTYHDTTGQLASVRNVFGDTFRYFYDLSGRLDSMAYPGAIWEKRFYDNDGRLTHRRKEATLFIGTDSGFAQAVLHADTLTYDGRERVLTAFTQADSVVNAYSAIGSLVRSFRRHKMNPLDQADEEFVSDALGNHLLRRFRGFNGANQIDDSTRYLYQRFTGRQVRVGVRSPSTLTSLDSLLFDQQGNKVWNVHETTGDLLDAPRAYYGADQKLRFMDKRTCIRLTDGSCDLGDDPGYENRGVFEEYRYDALGRRILVRSRTGNTCVAHCDRVIERTVWDGDQVLYDIRYQGATGVTSAQIEQDTGAVSPLPVNVPYGRVMYTHGLGVDEPLSVTRMNYTSLWSTPQTVIPHRNWRGLPEFGSFDTGTQRRCTNYADPATCIVIDWPAPHLLAFNAISPVQNYIGPQAWFGHLIPQLRDATGQQYKRNRYYDPGTGRFTQEDPIGLAGGLNLYGYAGGDPITYGDPFGLKVTVKGDRAWRTIETLIKGSRTFNRLYSALYYAPASKVDYTIQEATVQGVERFSGGASSAGHTIVVFNTGTSMIATDAMSDELAVHELLHALGGFAKEVGKQTGVPAACESHAGWSRQCDAFLEQIRAEMRAWREQQERERQAKQKNEEDER